MAVVGARVAFAIGLLFGAQAAVAVPGDVAPQGAPDGHVDSGDALVALKMIRGLLPINYGADVAPIGAPDGVVDIKDVQALQKVALGLESLPDMTVGQINNAALSALKNSNLPGAKYLFDQAVSKVGSGTSQADKDTAYFFRGVTRVLVFLADLSSDRDPSNGLQRVSDLIEAFGCVAGPTVDYLSSWNRVECPTSSPTGAPDGNAIQTFLYGPFRDELLGALDDFSHVSTGFDLNWNAQPGDTGIDNDYSDVLVLKGLFEALISQVEFIGAFNTDVDIHDADVNPPASYQAFMANHPNFLHLVSGGRLTAAKNHLDQAFADLDAGIQSIRNETDDQSNDFINLQGTPTADVDAFLRVLSRGRTSLGGTAVGVKMDTTAGYKAFNLTLSIFFSNLDLRNQWPPYTGDLPGFFPDPTLNGAIGGVNINEDGNGDGIPDVLQ